MMGTTNERKGETSWSQIRNEKTVFGDGRRRQKKDPSKDP